MLAIGTFFVLLPIYLLFLGWCFYPLFVRKSSTRIRPLLGVLLLSGNLFLPFLWPIQIALIPLGFGGVEIFTTVALFLNTAPAFARNLASWSAARASVIDVTFPVELGGIRYALSQQVACIRREMYSTDKGMTLLHFREYPTSFGGALYARVGNALIAADFSQLCSYAEIWRLDRGPLYRDQVGLFMPFYVLRAEGDRIQQYQLWHRNEPLIVDDIVLYAPQIVNVEDKSAKAIIPSSIGLWPMARDGEMSVKSPETIERLNREVRNEPFRCVASIEVLMYSTSDRRDEKRYANERVPADPNHCREWIARALETAPVVAPALN